MTISGVGLRSGGMIQSILTMRNQLDDLQRQLGTGQKSVDYAGLGVSRGLTVGLRSHLSAISGYTNTINNVGVRLSLAQTSLSRIADIASETKSATTAVSGAGSTLTQQTAQSGLAEMLGLLNTQSGDRYIYSGLATDTPAVDTLDHILNGNGSQAGLKQVISERNQADLGADGQGRLVISSPTATSVSVAEDAAPSVFGFKLSSVSTSIGTATVSQPSGTPPSASIDLGATNPNPGDKVAFTFNLPDGTSESVTLTATASANPGPNEFTIGANSTQTASNLNAALTGSVKTLAATSLAAASAVAASNDFFNTDATHPPMRVAGTSPFYAATSLTAGTPANTVSWYTGENGTQPARSTATAQVDQSINVSYGMRANEEGIRWVVQNVATLAAMDPSATDPDATARNAALNDRIRQNLDVPPGTQKVQDIESELANVQQTLAAATDRHQQTTSSLSDLLQNISGVDNNEVAAQILAMQTNLQASLQTTAMLYQTSILNYLPT